MFQLVYASTACGTMTASQLQDILREARTFNTREGITGVLLYHRGAFLQVLEGEEEVVEAIFAVIERDIRHRDVIVLSRCILGKREFNGWSMKFLDTSDWNIQPGLIGYNSLHQFAESETVIKPYLRKFHAGLSNAGLLACPTHHPHFSAT